VSEHKKQTIAASSTADIDAIILKAEPSGFGKIPETFKPEVRSIVRRILATVTLTQYSGPLPQSDEIKKYEEVIPGAGNRIIKMAEKQSDHRMNIEKWVIVCQQVQGFSGQICGLVIAIAFLYGAVHVADHGNPVLGGVLGGTTLVALVTIFVLGKRSQQQDLAKKEYPQLTE
jgi:uncharacterized membrane protein